MKPFLLYEHFNDKAGKKIINESELIQDLNLHIIFKAMAQNDNFLYDTSKSVILNSLTEPEAIIYRQNILKDCINNKSTIYGFYNTAATALKEAAYYNEFNQPSYARIVSASERVQKSLGLLELLIVRLEELKNSCCLSAKSFKSKGLTTFCTQIIALLTNEFFIRVKDHIAELESLSIGGKIVIGSNFGIGMNDPFSIKRTLQS